MIYIPVPGALLFAALFLLAPAACVLATLSANRWDTRRQRAKMEAREKKADERDEAADIRDDLQTVRDKNLDDREEAVIQREQHLRRHSKEVEAAVAASATQYDTEFDLRDWDELPKPPNPHENADTVDMPVSSIHDYSEWFDDEGDKRS